MVKRTGLDLVFGLRMLWLGATGLLLADVKLQQILWGGGGWEFSATWCEKVVFPMCWNATCRSMTVISVSEWHAAVSSSTETALLSQQVKSARRSPEPSLCEGFHPSLSDPPCPLSLASLVLALRVNVDLPSGDPNHKLSWSSLPLRDIHCPASNTPCQPL